MEAQFQIRQNAMEAQDFMQDLLSWQHTLKDKSSKSLQQPTADASAPAVRGRAAGSVSAAPEELQRPANASGLAKAAVDSTAPPAAHTYQNYRKWDTFDVDAALQEDTTASTVTSKHMEPSGASAKPPNGHPQPQQLNGLGSAAHKVARPPPPTAAALKDRGNKLYQAGYYTDAISCYTQSVELQPTSIAYANRAMSKLRLKQYTEAEQDCTAALQLDPSYVKALHRRGTARKQLGKFLEAAADFEEALRLEPANKTLSADRDDAAQQYMQQEKIPPNCVWTKIPIHQSAETDQQQPTAAAAAAPLPSPAAAIVENVPISSSQAASIHFQESQADKTVAAPVPVVPAPPAAAPVRAGLSNSPVHVTPAAAAAATATVADGIHNTSVVRSSSTVPAQDSKLPINATAAAASAAVRSPPRQATSTSAAAAAAAAQLAARLSAGLRTPRNSNDFEAAWRSFKGDQGLQVRQHTSSQTTGLMCLGTICLCA